MLKDADKEVEVGAPMADPAFLAALQAGTIKLKLGNQVSEPQAPNQPQESSPGAVAPLAPTEIDRPSPDSISAPPEVPEGPPLAEIVSHAAIDSIFFCQQFFPKTFRQASPGFHKEIWDLLDDPTARYINIQVRRGGGKTTLLRAYMAKRIAYGLSRTILYVGASQDKAIDSIDWVKKQVERDTAFKKVFGLVKSKPWGQDKATLKHGPEEYEVTLIALGITGSLRGLNIDDYRPDLIIIDDVIKDDNAATPEQRHKIAELILGAVKESLAPTSEVPDAKMVIINTPQDYEDLSQRALRDTQFKSARFGCWTAETEELPLELQESSWPERWSSEELRAEKQAAINRNMLSTFARELECKLTTPETSAFRPEWIGYFGEDEQELIPPRHEMWVELVIDPVPPPSEIQISKGLVGKDFEALTVVGRWRNKYYCLETVYNRGHEPNWTVATFLDLCYRWQPRKVIVEAVAYQATLAWLLRQAQKRVGRYYPIEEFKDKRKKIDRIRDGLAGPLSSGAVFVRRSQATLISQLTHFPGKNPSGTHDDVLETFAIGVASLSRGWVGDTNEDTYQFSEQQIPALKYQRGAP